MRAFKTLLATLAIFVISTAANAQSTTTIRITGSSAFRSAAHNAILAVMTGETYGYIGSSLGSANQAIFFGTVGADNVIIKTSWTGSVAGTQTVSQSLPVAYLPDTTTVSGGGTSGAAAVTLTTTPASAVDIAIPDIGMADTFQGSTPFTTPPLVETKVGIQPFKWLANRGLTQLTVAVDTIVSTNVATVASTASLSAGMTITGNVNIPNDARIGAITSGTTFTIVRISDGSARNATATASGVNTVFVSPAPISNITPQLAQALFSNGKIALSLFTGNSADEGVNVWAVGRDPDSGTRLTAFAESGIGVKSSVVQYQPTISGGAVTSQIPWPVSIVNGITFAQGNGGQNSGGNLVTYLGATTSAINGYYVSYLSTGDATNAINIGARELSYNGTFYSLNGVTSGNYPFWCYEFLTYRSGTTGVPLSVANALILQIKTVDAPIKLSQMRVSRAQDGGLITQDF